MCGSRETRRSSATIFLYYLSTSHLIMVHGADRMRELDNATKATFIGSKTKIPDLLTPLSININAARSHQNVQTTALTPGQSRLLRTLPGSRSIINAS